MPLSNDEVQILMPCDLHTLPSYKYSSMPPTLPMPLASNISITSSMKARVVQLQSSNAAVQDARRCTMYPSLRSELEKFQHCQTAVAVCADKT